MNRRSNPPASDLRVRHGVTVVEMLVVIAIIGLLVSIIVPAVQAAREVARRLRCQANLHEMGIAIHNHESQYGFVPTNDLYRSILPFIDKSELFDDLRRGQPISANELSVTLYLCPSDFLAIGNGDVNYGINEGYGYQVFGKNGIRLPVNGQLVQTRWRDVVDGVSNTACLAEQLFRPSPTASYITPVQAPTRYLWYTPTKKLGPTQFDSFVSDCQQRRSGALPIFGNSFSALGAAEYGYNHNLGPNAIGCMNGDWTDALGTPLDYRIVPASSLHSGGVNVLWCDGRVRFVSSEVDLAVWRAAGTRAGQEAREE